MRYSMKHNPTKTKRLFTTMQTTTPNPNTPSEVLASWQRARSDDEITSFLSRRTDMLGDIDDDDFELAMI